ncbi:MAG: hypothetical protein U5K56_11915 [Halioglobus sp.]|nr:hypothetical protein [Halioglobus sp.]
MIDALLFDLSGVLYVGDEVVPGAVDAVARTQRADCYREGDEDKIDGDFPVVDSVVEAIDRVLDSGVCAAEANGPAAFPHRCIFGYLVFQVPQNVWRTTSSGRGGVA